MKAIITAFYDLFLAMNRMILFRASFPFFFSSFLFRFSLNELNEFKELSNNDYVIACN